VKKILYGNTGTVLNCDRHAIDLGLTEETSWKLLRQLLEGLQYVHSQGMIHRDLKPSNVFLDANGNAKLGDFGLATVKSEIMYNAKDPEAYISADNSLTSDIGTPCYVAPEILTGRGRYNNKVDMFSLGICFFEMIYPFNTAMQRNIVLRDVRQLRFPSDFDVLKLDKQKQILEKVSL
jgi:translation initiation factor 2-alpha kinase 4